MEQSSTELLVNDLLPHFEPDGVIHLRIAVLNYNNAMLKQEVHRLNALLADRTLDASGEPVPVPEPVPEAEPEAEPEAQPVEGELPETLPEDDPDAGLPVA